MRSRGAFTCGSNPQALLFIKMRRLLMHEVPSVSNFGP
jgi:hypothetical protein